jgi:hypothetical protein
MLYYLILVFLVILIIIVYLYIFASVQYLNYKDKKEHKRQNIIINKNKESLEPGLRLSRDQE